MRLQLALNVRNIDEAVAYHSKLFGAAPHKRRDGYANFAIDRPPLKLVLFENAAAKERLNHLGVEVLDHEIVESTLKRLSREGIVDEVQHGTTCCHAIQEKIRSREPDGLRQESYRIIDDEPGMDKDPIGKACCAGMAGNAGAGRKRLCHDTGD